MSEPREPGCYYWVSLGGTWIVAEWFNDAWHMTRNKGGSDDSAFDAIGPRVPDYKPGEPQQAAERREG